MEPIELPEKIHADIVAICATGDEYAEAGEYERAVGEYNRAWTLVPDPKNNWNASTWILAAIADACFLAGHTTSAREALQYAMTCPGAIGDPFLHLRYGEVLFDAGEEDAAAEELIRAYMGAGEEIYISEDPKYLAFLRTRAKL